VCVLRLKLKSEVYLTSSRFSFFWMLTLLLLKNWNILRFLKILFFGFFGNGPGTDGDRFMIYVLLSAWFRSRSQCFISFARDLRRRTHQKMRWILKINFSHTIIHLRDRTVMYMERKRTYDLIGWEHEFLLSSQGHHFVDLVRCKTRFWRDCEKEPLNTLYMVRGINKLESYLNISSLRKSFWILILTF